MTYVIRNAGSVGILLHGSDQVPIGAYLQHYDPDAKDGFGVAEWTTDPAKAMTFVDVAAAWQCYGLQSTVRPLRSDGKPNRPLTTHSVEVSTLEV